MTLSKITAALAAAGIDDPEREARILVSHFCDMPISVLLCERELEFDNHELDLAVARRLKREPLQYIIGRWSFMHEEYEVTPDCLIPRPETELIAEAAIDLLPTGGRLLDLCCGSGCILVSALAARHDAAGVGVDLFPRTLECAKRNAMYNGTSARAEFILGDITDADFAMSQGSFNVITSNPPYIKTAALSTLAPELAYEPPAALDGGEDGLRFYHALISLWHPHLSPGGVMLLEIGADQGEEISLLCRNAGLTCEIRRDYAGLDRMAVIKSSL